MKKFNVLIFLVINFLTGFTQQISNNVSGNAMCSDKFGNIFFAGSFEGNALIGKTNIHSHGKSDLFIAKFNASGTCLWVTIAGEKDDEACNDIAVDEHGNTYITGNAEGKIFIAKHNASGDLIWILQPGIGDGKSIEIDAEGNIYVTGAVGERGQFGKETYKRLADNTTVDFFMTKLTTKGVFIWTVFGGSKLGDDYGTSLKLDGRGSIFVGGIFSETSSFNGQEIVGKQQDGFYANYTTTSELNWIKKISGSGYEYVSDLDVDAESNVAVCGYYSKALEIGKETKRGYGNITSYMISSSEKSDLNWAKYPNTGSSNVAHSAKFDKEGNVYYTGYFRDSSNFTGNKLMLASDDNDIFIVKYKKNGQFAWLKRYGENGNDTGLRLLIDKDGKPCLMGSFYGSVQFDKNLLNNVSHSAIFYSVLNPINGNCEKAFKIASIESATDNVKRINYFGKLLVGKTEVNPLVDQSVLLQNTSGEVVQKSTTDEYGDFSFKNLDVSENYNISIEKNDNISASEDIYIANQSGVVLSKLMRNNDNTFSFKLLPAEIAKMEELAEETTDIQFKKLKEKNSDEITVVENILYEPNSSQLKEESKKTLLKIVKALKESPNINLQITSHTDARGDDQANLSLSEKRSTAVIAFLVAKGILESRLTGIGMGESKVLNRCKNDIDCSEIEHSYNRRTEFKYIKTIAPPANK